jgi:hypothetical protein
MGSAEKSNEAWIVDSIPRVFIGGKLKGSGPVDGWTRGSKTRKTLYKTATTMPTGSDRVTYCKFGRNDISQM